MSRATFHPSFLSKMIGGISMPPVLAPDSITIPSPAPIMTPAMIEAIKGSLTSSTELRNAVISIKNGYMIVDNKVVAANFFPKNKNPTQNMIPLIALTIQENGRLVKCWMIKATPVDPPEIK